ncbi:MAG: RNA methyltransferase [Marinilabilia sp.]
MVGKSKKKLITSLSQKKYRDRTGLFVAEGPKLVNDLLASGLQPELLFSTGEDILTSQSHELTPEIIDDQSLKKISFLKSPQNVLAVFKKPAERFHFGDHANRLTLALDGVRDPGNMGTILRLADWFGFSHIVCSHDSADVFNPKVVQASMGALGRVTVHYTELDAFCRQSSEELKMPVFGTFMDGENIYTTSLPSQGLIVMGNEGSGITHAVQKTLTSRLSIPSFGEHPHSGMESLNVAMATAVVCAEFRRQNMFA